MAIGRYGSKEEVTNEMGGTTVTNLMAGANIGVLQTENSATNFRAAQMRNLVVLLNLFTACFFQTTIELVISRSPDHMPVCMERTSVN